MVYDGADGYVLFFGGTRSTGVTFGDTWEFRDNRWINVTTSMRIAPSPRGDFAFAYDATDKYVVLFGGLNSANNFLNDTWTFVHGQWRNVTSTASHAPSPRFQSQMVYDSADGVLLLFGGRVSDPISGAVLDAGDSWQFVRGHWTDLTASLAESPAPRDYETLADDPQAGYVLMLGGMDVGDGTVFGDTWTYHHGHWTDISTSLGAAPSPRRGALAVFATGARGVVLFGGDSSVYNGGLADTWIFFSGHWRNVTSQLGSPAPPPRWSESLASDPAHDEVVVFGGCSVVGCYSQFGDTWAVSPVSLLSVPPPACVSPEPGVPCLP